MANGGAPDYNINIEPSAGITTFLQPMQVPSVEGMDKAGKAIASFGSELQQVGARLAAAQKQTGVATATTEYLTRLDALERDSGKDEGNPQNTPQNFTQQQRELEQELSARISDPAIRERTLLEWRRAGLAAGKRVESHALTREADVNVASLDQQQNEALRSASFATSDVEREAAVSRYSNAVTAAADHGWISKQAAVKRGEVFGFQLDDADVVRGINDNPQKAAQDLQDPNKFTHLGPLHRQNRINEALAKSDQLATLEIQNTATRDPARAAATVGRIGGAADGDAVFDRIMSPSAQGGDFLRDRVTGRGVRLENVDPVFSSRLTQALSDAEAATGKKAPIRDLFRTYQDQAAAYGRFQRGEISLAAPPGHSRHERGQAADIDEGPVLDWLHQNASRYGLEFLPGRAGRIDAGHIQLAKNDPEVPIAAPKNVDVAAERDRWRAMVSRYDGQLAPAIAAFQASPEAADRWQAAAQQKFGRYFHADQFLTVVDDDNAKKAIEGAFKRADAPMNGGGLAPAATLHAANVVHQQIVQEDSQRRQSINAVAAVSREGQHPAKIFEAGFDVDPQTYQLWAAQQQTAAEGGSMEAAKALKEAEFQRSMLPFRQQALRASPADLERFVEAEDARMRGSVVSDDEKNRLDVFKATLKSVKEARDHNIVGLAEDAQMVPAAQRVSIAPNADPSSQEFRAAMALRGAQANAAVLHYGGKAIALKPAELDAMKQRFADAAPGEKFELLKGMGATLTGRAFEHTMDAVVGKDPVMQFVGRVADARPDLAREILKGRELIKAAGEKNGSGVMRAALARTLGGSIYPDPEMQDAVIKSAEALAVSRADSAHVLYEEPDQVTREKAIEEITGPLIRRNGARVPVTPGVPEAKFTAALDFLSEGQLAQMGGAYGRDGKALSAQELGRYAVLKPLAPGSSRYVVGLPDPRSRDGFAPVFSQGLDPSPPAPLTFDMRALAADVGGQRHVNAGQGGALRRAQRNPVAAGGEP
jgi:hypothetical protein